MQRITQMNRRLRLNNKSNLTQMFSKRRKWVYSESFFKPTNTKDQNDSILNQNQDNLIKIMSYNILADNNIRQYLYKGRKLSDISFKKRKKNLLTEISTSNADIICLQEVEDIHSSFISSYFKQLNYDSYFKRKADPMKADGCMILWNSKKFNLITKCWGSLGIEAGINYFAADLSIVSISEVMEDVSKERNMRLRNGHPLFVQRQAPKSFNNRFINFSDEMYYHSLVMYTVLEDNLSKKKSLIVTTHLLFNSKRGHLKLSQLVIIFKSIEKLKKIYDIENIFFCGDFNFVPNSALYHYISNQQFDLKALLEEYSNQNLLVKNNYKTIENIIAIGDMKYAFNKGPYTSTGFNRNNTSGLDYSLYNNLKFLESLLSLEILCNTHQSKENEIIYFNNLNNHIIKHLYRDIDKDLSAKEQMDLRRQALTLELNKLSFQLNFKSAYSHVNLPNDEEDNIFNGDCKVTQFGDHIKVPVDYIWYSRDGVYKPIAVLEVPEDTVLEKMKKRLPYKEFGSDHFSISAIFCK